MSYKRRAAAAATALAALAAVAARATAWHFRRRTLQRDFARDGYVIVRGLLTAEEVARVNASCSAEGGVASHAYGRDDGLGRRTRLSLWNHPGNDVLGALARIPRTRGLMEWLLGGEVYHYHSKLMMKDARTGGAHLWHQDYGYWVNNGCAFPRMGTMFLAVDRIDAENGGLRVIKGSHEMGLVQHGVGGAQAEVDPTRLAYAKRLLETVQLELAPGDAVFFHSLLLHASDQNKSDRRRWAILVAYNRVDNDPLIDHHHPRYTPLARAADDAILRAPLVDASGKDFMNPADDESVAKYKSQGFH